MTWRWPSLQTLRRFAVGGFLVVLASLLILRLFALTPMARGLAETRIEALSVRGQTFEIQGFKGDLLGRMSVASLIVSDSDGAWAEAENIELAWSPLGLFSGHLQLKDVTSDSLILSRRPALAPAGTGGGSFIDRYSVNEFSLSRLALLDGVAGPSQNYTLEGELSAGGEIGAIGLDMTPLGAAGDRANIQLDWNSSKPLTGQVRIEGVPGGLLATVLKTSDNARISVELDASGTLTDWQLTASSTVGGQSILEIDAARENKEYSAQGHLNLAQIEWLTRLNPRLGDRIVFQGTLDHENIVSGEIGAETVSLSFSGKANSMDNGLIIEALDVVGSDLNGSALTGSAAFDLPQFRANGTLTLSSDARRFEGEINTPTIAFDQYALRGANARGSFVMKSAAYTIDAELQANSMDGLPARIQDLLDVDPQLDVNGRFDRAGRIFDVEEFELGSARTQIQGGGSITIGGAVMMAGDLTLVEAAPVERFAGNWSVEGERLNAARLQLNGAIEADQTIPALSEVIGADAYLDLSLQRQIDGIILQRAALRSSKINAQASGALQQNQVSIKGDVSASALSFAGADLNALQGQFDLSGPFSAPALALDMSAETLEFQGRKLSHTQLVGNVELSDAMSFSLRAGGDYLATPASLELDGARRDGVFDLTRITGDWADMRVTGNAQLTPSEIRSSELDLHVSGSPLGFGTVEADLSYQSEVLASTVSLESATLGWIQIDRGELSLNGTWPIFTGALNYAADVPMLGETRFAAGAHGLTADAEKRIISLDGTARLADQEFEFTTPLTFNLHSGVGISGQVAVFGGQIDLSLKPLNETASTLAMTGLSLSAFGDLINRPGLRGELNGDADIALVEGQLSGKINATIAGLARGAPDAPSADLRLIGLISGNRLDAAIRTEDSDAAVNFTAQSSIPLTHRGQAYSIRPLPGAAIPVRLQGEGDIAPIWALAAPMNLRLDGDLSLDIDNGPGTNWRFQGPLNFENGAFEDGVTGLHLREIEISARLRPDGIDFDTARARGRNSGTVEATGLYGFDGNGAVTLQLNRLNAFKRSDVSATVSGSAEVDRQNRRTQISGDFEIDQARVNLERLPGAGYTTLDVVFRDDQDVVQTQSPVREAIVLDLDVSADRRVFVVGSGVDTEWGLNARVTGSPGRPNVVGRANLIRGEADLLSRRFRFSEGRVRFIGAPEDTEFTLRADRTSDDITSSITLSGSIMDPEITLSADPSLPDDEILARALFGRSPSELSPLQAAQLAGAAAQLAGGDALNLVGQLQAATGLDRLDFGLDDDGAATLSTGKYIAEDVYLEIETGGTGAPGVALEWTPLENVAIDAEVDPELGPKVAIQWKRDFDRLPGEPKPE